MALENDNNGSQVTPAALRAAASELVGRMQEADRWGLSYDTSALAAPGYNRDLLHLLGIPKKLSPALYEAEYKRGGVAARVVEALPDATWVSGVEVVEDEEAEEPTAFDGAVADLFQRTRAWSKLNRADVLAGLGRYSVLLIGGPGELAEPLERVSADAIAYLQPYGEARATIAGGDINEDPASDRFGLPERYRLKLGGRYNDAPVHWSRVIHVAEGALDSELYGQPRLQRIYTYLKCLERIVGGGSEASWRLVNMGLQVDIDPEMHFTADDETALSDQIDEYVHELRRVIRTRGVKVNPLGSVVPAFGPNVDCLLKLISASTGIPARILSGSEMGELASSQDRSNWNDRVNERRLEFASPVVRSLVERLVSFGALPEPRDVVIRWPKVDELNEAEKADVADKMAAANQKAGGMILTPDEIRRDVWGYDPLEPEPEDEPAPVPPELEGDEDGGAEGRAAARSAELEAVQEAAEAHEDAVAAAIESAWRAVADGLTMENPEITFDAADDALRERLPEALTAVLAEGAEAYARVVRARGEWRAAALEADFDATTPGVVALIEARVADLVTEVNAETRAAIRDAIRQGVEDGIPPAKLVQRLRKLFGLRSDQIAAVENLRRRMAEAEGGSLVYAGRTKIRIPKGGATEELIEKRAAEYAGRLLNQRARLIARTETMREANEGVRQLWIQAQNAGNLPQDAKRKWIATPDERVREEHAAMQGQVRALDEPFERPDGKQIEPGQEPNCRCSQGIA